MRQKFRNNFVSAASVTRHPPQSGDAATKIGSLSPWASCAQCCQMEYRKFLEIWGQNFSRNEKKSGDSHFHFGILLPVIGS